MSVAVISRNPDLKKLQDEGYELEVCEGCAIIRNVPYLDSSKSVQYGLLVSPLNMSGELIHYDNDHTIHFQGTTPHRASGEALNALILNHAKRAYAGISTNMQFSNKPAAGFRNYYEKFTHYIRILTAEAQAIDPSVTATTFRKVVFCDDSPFVYADTNASRGGIMADTDKFKTLKIAIVGLGGTGSYVLDQVAKTPVAEIHLFDGDVLCQHNAFRAPGAPGIGVFEKQEHKADYFRSIYGHMHTHIVSHPYYLDEGNANELRDMDFVFITMDSGASKQAVVNQLKTENISFVDCGIDVTHSMDKIIGMTRSTLIENADSAAIDKFISFEEADKDLYQSNIQIADLNAFCAITAVIQWKKHCGFYLDNVHKENSVFTTNTGEFVWD